MVAKRFDVHLARIRGVTDALGQMKPLPCLVVSPDEMNRYLPSVIVAPVTAAVAAGPTRVACRFRRKDAQIVLDRIRTIDGVQLVEKLGVIDAETQARVLSVLQAMFAE